MEKLKTVCAFWWGQGVIEKSWESRLEARLKVGESKLEARMEVGKSRIEARMEVRSQGSKPGVKG